MEIEQLVYETLMQASSQHPDMLKPAEQKLKEWEVEPGFYSVLFVRWAFSLITCHKFNNTNKLIFREYFPTNR